MENLEHALPLRMICVDASRTDIANDQKRNVTWVDAIINRWEILSIKEDRQAAFTMDVHEQFDGLISVFCCCNTGNLFN